MLAPLPSRRGAGSVACLLALFPSEWVKKYWSLLSEEEYDYLKHLVGGRQHHLRHLFAACFNHREHPSDWTLVDGEHSLYIPTLAQQYAPAKNAGLFETGWDAYSAVRGLLTTPMWEKLKTITTKHFKRCRKDYLKLASILCPCFASPFGTVEEGQHESFSKQIASDYPSHSAYYATLWITGCLLQYCEADTNTLVEFCVTTLRYRPDAKPKENKPRWLKRFWKIDNQLTGTPEDAEKRRETLVSRLESSRITFTEFIDRLYALECANCLRRKSSRREKRKRNSKPLPFTEQLVIGQTTRDQQSRLLPSFEQLTRGQRNDQQSRLLPSFEQLTRGQRNDQPGQLVDDHRGELADCQSSMLMGDRQDVLMNAEEFERTVEQVYRENQDEIEWCLSKLERTTRHDEDVFVGPIS